MNEKSIYIQLKEKALPFMTGYQTDLTKHDRNDIRTNACIPFLHFTRQNGTDIIFLTSSDKYPPAGEKVKYLFGYADRHHLLKEKETMFKYWYDSSNILTHYFDGKKLVKISSQKAIEVINDYVNTIKKEWKEYKSKIVWEDQCQR